jgi:hypothetical protein
MSDPEDASGKDVEGEDVVEPAEPPREKPAASRIVVSGIESAEKVSDMGAPPTR